MALAKRVRSFTTVDMERLAEETANVPRIKCTIFCHCEGDASTTMGGNLDVPYQNVIVSCKYFLCYLSVAYVCITAVLPPQTADK